LQDAVFTLAGLGSSYGEIVGAATRFSYGLIAVDAYNVTQHFGGYLRGDPVDATHVALGTTSLLFGVASAATTWAPPVSVGLGIIGSGFGVADFYAGLLFGR
jgi:hypothetical protein